MFLAKSQLPLKSGFNKPKRRKIQEKLTFSLINNQQSSFFLEQCGGVGSRAVSSLETVVQISGTLRNIFRLLTLNRNLEGVNWGTLFVNICLMFNGT
jgi:hypothetical protein